MKYKYISFKPGLIILAVIACLIFAQYAHAGKLDDFEAEVNKEETNNDNKNQDGGDHHDGHHDRHRNEARHGKGGDGGHCDDDRGFLEAIGQIIVEVIARGVVYGIVEGGSISLERVRDSGEPYNGRGVPGREGGEALIPFLRLDTAYQDVESDVFAYDIRIEAGYGPLGVQTRFTRYEEEWPRDDLEMIQTHILYRASVMDFAELDLGLGGLVVNGDGNNSGMSFTMPLLIHPWKFLGFELRPAWASVNGRVVQDYDLAVLAGWSYVGCRAGYRWIRTGSESLDGPYAGMTVRF